MKCDCGKPMRVTSGGKNYCWDCLPTAAPGTAPPVSAVVECYKCNKQARWKVQYDGTTDERVVCDDHMSQEFADNNAISAGKLPC